MVSPLELPVPNETTERIAALARDLVYGVIEGYWQPYAAEGNMRTFHLMNSPANQDKADAFLAKWIDEVRPSTQMLQIFGYLSGTTPTQKAFLLLQQPASPPSVFISYKRGYSSTFGLLIEARLRAMGVEAFIDRSLDTGPWPDQLEEKIKTSNYFVCLLAPETLKSVPIQQEIRWALKYQKLFIPIWHSGFKEDLIPDEFSVLGLNHAIVIQSESAEAYHDGVEKLINRLGYSTVSNRM